MKIVVDKPEINSISIKPLSRNTYEIYLGDKHIGSRHSIEATIEYITCLLKEAVE